MIQISLNFRKLQLSTTTKQHTLRYCGCDGKLRPEGWDIKDGCWNSF
jgi:hypothetical protein